MPNRLLKDSVCTSDSIDQLGWFEEVVFYRLIVNCDDYGRFDGRPAVIKSRLFPLKDNLTIKSVVAAIEKLARIGLITLYEHDGRPFLFLPTWELHQQVRSKKSKFPDPVNICNHLISNDIKCPRNPIQSNPIRIQSESESESNAHARDVEAEFDAFWKAYPRKAGNKKKALEAFAKAEVPLETLLEAIERQKKTPQWTKDGGQFIPHPTTWLNGKRWEDEVQTTGSASANPWCSADKPLDAMAKKANERLLAMTKSLHASEEYGG